MSKQILLSPQQLDVTINRLAQQLVENYTSLKDLVFIGIQPRGIKVSERIVEQVRKICPGEKIDYGILDITFYRDDVREEFHKASNTDISFSIEDKIVVLMDDVLYTGRTIRAALDALQDFGRPKKVELCVLVNRRFSRQLPIQPDYCGKAIDSTPAQKVKVEWDSMEVVMY
ncbi:MAG: bifunctional pyr operon transcriptional regulator/uracil phosphoribosyltransferase PyrR [Sphingobacteriales bacterium]|nr:MAG: bifunctional pyr operon transcriptional regulator/uracil phosphoribosyltransferase PyrR [Sphingobacteriales bacterium]